MTAAQREQYAAAEEMIRRGIVALPVAQAIGALQAALTAHPDITPEMLHSTGNFLCQYADEMERRQ